MKISNNGLNLIKDFEGCKLKAYKAVSTEKYYTIGYGHYGSDVKEGSSITKEQATELLKKDVSKFETKVNKYDLIYHFNQNQFDALVSFCYNIGNIDGLTDKGTASISLISKNMLLYNKSGGKVLAGLVRRRAAEQKLFNTAIEGDVKYLKYTGTSNSLVDALKAIGVDSSFSTRKKLALANGISNYSGMGSQNTTMLIMLKKGTLKSFS